MLERDFPTVTALCRARGIDPATEPIPVAPGAHYACGGIRADMDGRTSVPGLYAVGEAASTGVHGANRLASNSLTEALITGRRAGNLLGQDLPEPPARLRLPAAGPGVNPAVRPALAAAMSRHAGVPVITRAWNASGRRWRRPRPPAGGWTWPRSRRPACTRSRSLVAVAALARAESRGCHRWRNAAGRAPPTGPATPWCASEAGQPRGRGRQAGVGAGA